MQGLPTDLSSVLERIYKETSPVSIFLYGSKARKDSTSKSDFEIGVLYYRDKKVSRRDLADKYSIDKVNIYPFVFEDFTRYIPDTPFQKDIYMRSMIVDGRTLFGQKVLEGMKPPTITLLDLLEEGAFQIARGYTAVLSHRENDLVGASAGFVKSCLFGARVLMIFKKGRFTSDYIEMAHSGKELGLSEENILLLKHALEVRNGKELDKAMLFTNISFLNKEVVDPIRKELENGNKDVL